MTTLASHADDEAASGRGSVPAQCVAPAPEAMAAGRDISCRVAAALACLHVGRPGSLIPPPYEVWLELQDLAFGGINDDAYSRTLHIHMLASISRVYGGFALAVIVALPLGMLIGRVPLVRQARRSDAQILRPFRLPRGCRLR